MLTSYRTIKSAGVHEIVIQKSRFITHIERVDTVGAATLFIEKIKKQHWNATHNCSAYIVGELGAMQKANDDGEPSGTAGIPMLEVLKKREIRNTVVVVTRYFGGIKLGAGGLIRAYGGAVSETLAHVGLVERKQMQVVEIIVDYPLHGKIEHELHHANYQVKQTHFSEKVKVDILVEVADCDHFIAWMTNITNGNLTTTLGDLEYVEVDLLEE